MLEKNGFRLAVFTVLGRQYLNLKSECPFLASDRMLAQLAGRADAVFVEIHAEATSEKQALGWYLDGRAAAVIGTHTHVPTADAGVLPKGTAFLCDAGMTGPYASVLGRVIEPVDRPVPRRHAAPVPGGRGRRAALGCAWWTTIRRRSARCGASC